MPTWDELTAALARAVAEQDTDDTDDLPDGWDAPKEADEVVAIFFGPHIAKQPGPRHDQKTPERTSETAQPGSRSAAGPDGAHRQRRRTSVQRDPGA